MPSEKTGPDQKARARVPGANGFSRLSGIDRLPQPVPVALAAGHGSPRPSGGLVGKRHGATVGVRRPARPFDLRGSVPTCMRRHTRLLRFTSRAIKLAMERQMTQIDKISDAIFGPGVPTARFVGWKASAEGRHREAYARAALMLQGSRRLWISYRSRKGLPRQRGPFRKHRA